jgi:hypothetical protein
MMTGLLQPVEFGLESLRPGSIENGVDRFVLSRQQFIELTAAGGKNILDRAEVLEQFVLRARTHAGQTSQREPQRQGIAG